MWNHVVISENIIIDYTGNVEIGNYVDISEDVRVYTHTYELRPERMTFCRDTIQPSNLVIRDYV